MTRAMAPSADPTRIDPSRNDSEESRAEGETQYSRLASHFQAMEVTELVRVAQAVEMARAIDAAAPTDEQIMDCLRPLIRPVRPERVATFQRQICICLEPFLSDSLVGTPKQRGAVRRDSLRPWWRLLMGSAYRPRLAAAEAEYRNALSLGLAEEIEAVVIHGRQLAAEATRALVAESERSPVRRRELVALLGSPRVLEDAAEIGAILAADAQLTPCFLQIRASAPRAPDGRVQELTPAAAVAAKNGYVRLTGSPGQAETSEYFFSGLMQMLVQPWQTLRLVRLLSADLSRAADPALDMIPTRLFADLTRTLGEIGRVTAGEGGTARRIWLMTCARLIADAGAMVQGMADEVHGLRNPEWERAMVGARQKVALAADQFATVAVRDATLVLPHREIRDKGADPRLVPDTDHMPTEEEVSVAQAAATLFSACRKVAEREGFDRSIRAKEADLETRFHNAITFRFDYLRARGKNPAVMAQLYALHQVLRAMPKTDPILDLIVKVERTIERFR